MFITLGGHRQAGPHVGRAGRHRPSPDCSDRGAGLGRLHVRCAAASADVQFGRILDAESQPSTQPARR